LASPVTENAMPLKVARSGRGPTIGGLLPTANALVGRLVPRAEHGTIYGITASATFSAIRWVR
jgi:DHA1 family multidrug resistance protein-like MFS transporter